KDLGYTGALTSSVTVKISVILTSGDGFVSNQTLPGIGAGTNTTSLGLRPNFTTVAGNQFASITKTTGQFAAPGGTIDGTAVVSDFGTANVIASQDTVTGFGDRNCITAT